MAIGPGKYDAEATRIQESYHAEGAIVIVLGGTMGSGFSVCGTEKVTIMLPELLKHMALEIKKDIEGGNAFGKAI